MVVEGNFSVLLWSKTGILSLNLELDQAEQKCWTGRTFDTKMDYAIARSGLADVFVKHVVYTLFIDFTEKRLSLELTS